MKITKVVMRQLQMPMKFAFTTSYGTVRDKVFLVIEAHDEDGTIGYGECVAFETPWYTEETVKSCWHMLSDFIIPSILHKEFAHPDEVNDTLRVIRMNNMAKSAMEGAFWDIYSQQQHKSLATVLGGVQQKIAVGISIGIQPTLDELTKVVAQAVADGYQRVKVKIKPGNDIAIIRHLREQFPHLALMADANAAYSLDDIAIFKELDKYQLLMIEQPLAYDDIVDHAELQQQITTPICLDESIHNLADVKRAVKLGSCKVINIKIGRVGGISEAKKIHDYCATHHIAVWCGGMLEAGIGRAHNIALTSLMNFTLPGDTAGSSHYWQSDIITPEVIANNGFITVPTAVGIGYEVDVPYIEQLTTKSKIFS